jgi:hypothetical protein
MYEGMFMDWRSIIFNPYRFGLHRSRKIIDMSFVCYDWGLGRRSVVIKVLWISGQANRETCGCITG